METTSFFSKPAKLEQAGEGFAIATVVKAQGSVPRHEGSKMLVRADGRIEGSIGGGELENRVIQESLEALADGKTRCLHYAFRDLEQGDAGVCGGEAEVFVEPIAPRASLVVVGGGHVGRAVAHLAKWLGFHVVVSDDRPEYAAPASVPDADEFVPGPLTELPQKTRITANTYLVLTTRGVPVDTEALPGLLQTEAAYIGVIGSRRRWETTARLLAERGVSREQIDRVTSPIGLELNAETPEEIAVSVMAEVVMLRRGGRGGAMAHNPAAPNAEPDSR